MPLRYVILLILTILGLSLSAQAPRDQAYALTQQSTALYGRDALPLLDSAKMICEQQSCADSSWAFLYRRLAVAYFDGYVDDQKAIEFADTARHFYERYLGTIHPLVANQHYSSGVIKREIGQLEAGINSITTAIEVLEQVPETEISGRDSTLLRWYYNLANTEVNWGDYAAGALHADKAAHYNRRFSGAPTYYDCLLLRLQAYRSHRTGDFSSAHQLFRQAAECMDNFSNDPRNYDAGLYWALRNLEAYTLAEMGQLETAINQFEQVAIGYRSLRQPPETINANLANNLHAQGWFNLQFGNYDQAQQVAQQAASLFEEIYPNEYYPAMANVRLLQGQIAQATGDYDTALSYYDKSLEGLSPGYDSGAPLSALQTTDNYLLYLELFDYRARCLTALGREVEARAIYEWLESVASRQRQTFRSGLSRFNILRYARPAYEQAIRLNLYPRSAPASPQQRERAWQYVSQYKGSSFREELQQKKALHFADIPRRVQRQERELAEVIRDLKTALYTAYREETPQDSLRLIIAEREQEYYQFLKQLETDYPRYHELKYAPSEPLHLRRVQDKLAKKQVALEYFWGVDSLYTFTISQTDLRISAQPVAGLEDSVRLYYELLSTGVGPECEARFTGLSHFLYQKLIPSYLSAESAAQSINRLIIIPDRLLHLVTFETLLERPVERLEGAQALLLKRFAISYLPSIRHLVTPLKNKRKNDGSFLGFGLEYDDATLNYLSDAGFGKKESSQPISLPCRISEPERSLGKLAYADDEILRVKEQIGGEARVNQQAIKRTFLDLAGDYNILHLAMHGTYDLEYPLNSSLLFNYQEGEDVALRAAEIYGMELNAEMVVLSACNTGYGQMAEGEGTMSLARAFNYAGSNSIVASLWTAVDYTTAEIMVLFYKYLEEGLPKDEALQQAKLEYLNDNMLSSPGTRSPYYWACSVIIGDTQPLMSKSFFSSYWWGVVLLTGLLFLFVRRKALKRT
ncbi:MAG: CHAT domain-containing protein [Bacteroidota bacterium]